MPRVKHGSRGTEGRVERQSHAILVVLRNCSDKRRCPVNGKDFIDVCTIKQVEAIHGQLQFVFLSEMHQTRHANVHGAQMIDDATSHGAKLLLGGESNGTLMPAVIVDFVTPEMEIFREESFGPSVSITRFKK